MKKLFLKNGSYLLAKVSKDTDGKYISIYGYPEDNVLSKLKYSIFSGKSATRQMLILADNINELPLWEILLIAEIYESFNQYFNNLNQ